MNSILEFTENFVVHLNMKKSFDLLFLLLLCSNCRVFVQIISNGMPMCVNMCEHISASQFVCIGSGASATLIYYDCVLYAAFTCFQRFCVSRTHIHTYGGLCLSRAHTFRLYIKTTNTCIAHDNKHTTPRTCRECCRCCVATATVATHTSIHTQICALLYTMRWYINTCLLACEHIMYYTYLDLCVYMYFFF